MEIMVAETLTVNSCLNVQLICAAQKYRFHTNPEMISANAFMAHAVEGISAFLEKRCPVRKDK